MKKKILLLCRSYFPFVGGIETSIYQLSKSLTKMGHSVTIITTSQPAKERRYEYASIVYANEIKSPFRLIPSINLKLLEKSIIEKFRETKNENFDIIIGRDTFMTILALKFFHIPTIYIPSMDVKNFVKTRVRNIKGIKDLILKLLENWQYKIEISNQNKLLSLADINIVFCNNMKRQLMQSYRIRKNIEVVYPGCSLEFVNLPKIKDNTDRLKLLYVGRLSYEKNLAMLFNALKQMKEFIQLTIVGDGYCMDELRELAKNMPNNIKIIFEGFKNNTAIFYKAADIFVLPSKYESFGQVIIEAFTCGTPVIGFATIPGKTNTAIDELVQDNITGFVCNEFTEKEIERCLCKAYNALRDGSIRYMEFECVSYAKRNCSWDKLAERSLSLLDLRNGDKNAR